MHLTAEGLTCIRGGRQLFRDLGFTLASGELLLVTGPNGAGKSSLLRLVAGFLRPAAGRIAFEPEDGRPLAEAVHYVGHLDGVKAAFTVAENLEFVRSFLRAGAAEGDGLMRLGLEALADVPAMDLSAGQRRRLALARLVVAPRPIWLLDEPTTALDGAGRSTLADLVSVHRSQGGMAILATHEPGSMNATREIRLGADA
jgi:heme exporter protein A